MSDTTKQQLNFHHQRTPGKESAERLTAARAGNQAEFSNLTEPHRRELLAHCYRMLGSLQEAEDQVQETLMRAWRRLDTYEGRAPLRAWLYKIATNACLDALDRRPRRTLPQQLHPTADPHEVLSPPVSEPIWLKPFPDNLISPSNTSPEARYESRESITLAFMIALQSLPPRQRAVLILRDVLDWQASEVAELLEVTVSAVNSMLHRARATLEKHYHSRSRETIRDALPAQVTNELLDRYVRAWEEADVDRLVSLLKEEARFAMPPMAGWFQGRSAIRAFISTTILAGEGRGRWHLQPVHVNAQHGFAWYRRHDDGDTYQAYAIQVLIFDGDLLAEVITFGYPALFPFFGLPLEEETS